MNNTRLQEILIDQFKKDFTEKTGKGVKIVICNKWQNEANFTTKFNYWAIVKLVFDYTGWSWSDTYKTTQYTDKYRRTKRGLKNDEKIFRRSLIDYICMHNGATLKSCADNTGRKDHTTIINSVNSFENRLETDYYTQKLFREIMEYLKENYYLYKDQMALRASIVEDNL